MGNRLGKWALRVSTDASRGLGHVKRSMLIANALNARSLFIDPGKIPDCLNRASFDLVQEDSRQTMARLEAEVGSGRFGAVMIDSYDAVPGEMDAFVARMDDTGTMIGQADAMVSTQYAESPVPERDSGRILACVRGPSYVPISRDFEPRPVRGRAQQPNILICMGARDSKNLTELALIAVADSCPDLPVRVILGAGALHAKAVRAACDRLGADCLIGATTRQMNELFQWADITIGAGGLSLLERMLVGVANLVVVLADNQEGQTAYLAGQGAVLRAGRFGDAGLGNRISDLCKMLVDDPDARISLASQGQKLLDHMGAERIADFLTQALAQWQETRH